MLPPMVSETNSLQFPDRSGPTTDCFAQNRFA